MKIVNDSVVAIDYTLHDDAGILIETTLNKAPVAYLHGRGQLPPGLERALQGHGEGEQIAVRLAPKDGYGEWQPQKAVRIPRSELPHGLVPEVGKALTVQGPHGPLSARLTEVASDHVILDGNHPLAGRHLRFTVHVRRVRAASAAELEAGRPLE